MTLWEYLHLQKVSNQLTRRFKSGLFLSGVAVVLLAGVLWFSFRVGVMSQVARGLRVVGMDEWAGRAEKEAERVRMKEEAEELFDDEVVRAELSKGQLDFFLSEILIHYLPGGISYTFAKRPGDQYGVYLPEKYLERVLEEAAKESEGEDRDRPL